MTGPLYAVISISAVLLLTWLTARDARRNTRL